MSELWVEVTMKTKSKLKKLSKMTGGANLKWIIYTLRCLVFVINNNNNINY